MDPLSDPELLARILGRLGGQYTLVGQTPVPEPNILKWAEWYATADRIVAQTEVGASLVSTVFLGLDHQFFKGPPKLFETMIFTDGACEDQSWRCSTWMQAEKQHADVVQQCEQRSHVRGRGEGQ